MKQILLVGVSLVMACGGIAVLDGDDAATATSTTATSTTASTSSGSSGCTSHEDCSNGVCKFDSGECIASCFPNACEPCGAGSVCDVCATSSAPDTPDCLAGCQAAQPGQCDDHDDCAATETCIFSEGRCATACPFANECANGQVCTECITSSCPCCEDCESACVDL